MTTFDAVCYHQSSRLNTRINGFMYLLKHQQVVEARNIRKFLLLESGVKRMRSMAEIKRRERGLEKAGSRELFQLKKVYPAAYPNPCAHCLISPAVIRGRCKSCSNGSGPPWTTAWRGRERSVNFCEVWESQCSSPLAGRRSELVTYRRPLNLPFVPKENCPAIHLTSISEVAG